MHGLCRFEKPASLLGSLYRGESLMSGVYASFMHHPKVALLDKDDLQRQPAFASCRQSATGHSSSGALCLPQQTFLIL